MRCYAFFPFSFFFVITSYMRAAANDYLVNVVLYAGREINVAQGKSLLYLDFGNRCFEFLGYSDDGVDFFILPIGDGDQHCG